MGRFLSRILERIDHKLGDALRAEHVPDPMQDAITLAYLDAGGLEAQRKLDHAVRCVETEERRLFRIYPVRERRLPYEVCLKQIFDVSQRRGQGVEAFAAEVDKISEASQQRDQLVKDAKAGENIFAIPLRWPS